MIIRFDTCVLALAATASFSLSAWGQTAGEGGNSITLNPIVVTGELIDRPLEDTATSAEVLNEKSLDERAGFETVGDILNQTPNVSALDGSSFAPTVRGVDGTGPIFGAFAYFAGTKPRLNWQIDGRSVNYYELLDSDFGIWDLEQVEVLRGPQSTITGRNSIAGTVVIKTKDPSFTPEIAAQAAGGNLDQRRFSGMINAPIVSDLLAVRLAADWLQSKSAFRAQPFLGVADPAEKDAISLRGKAVFLPDIGKYTKLLLNFNYNESTAPNAERVNRPFGNRTSNSPALPVHTTKAKSVSAQFTTALNDYISFDLNTTYTDFSLKRNTLVFLGPANIDNEEYVIEPKINFKNSNGFSATAGIYYFNANQDELLIFGANNIFDDRTETFAAYAEAIIPLNEQLSILLGTRYEREERKRVGGDAGPFVNVNFNQTYESVMPKVGLNWKPTETMTWGAQVSSGYNAGGAGVAFNSPAPFPVIPYQYGKESVWSYELYGRQSFAGGKIRTTQNVFFSEYKDMQLPFDVAPANPSPFTVIVRNFDKVRTYGAEIGFSAQVTDTLSIFGNLGLLKTNIVNSSGANLEGRELQRAPNVTANIGFTWTDGNWRASGSARYSDSYYSDTENQARGKVDPFVIADAELAYDFGGAQVFGSVKNIFDYDKPIGIFPSKAGPAGDTAINHQPRTFLFGVRARF